MLNPVHGKSGEQIEAGTEENAGLDVARGKIELPVAMVEVETEEDRPGQSKRETTLLGGLLRLAGATVGFLVGGSAGAALGSIFGELAGDIAAERTSTIWPMFGRAFLNPNGAYHEEDASDPS